MRRIGMALCIAAGFVLFVDQERGYELAILGLFFRVHALEEK